MFRDRLQYSNVLVTGGSSETGPFICEAFAGYGANILTTWHSNEAGARKVVDAARKLGVGADAVFFDILSQQSIDGLADYAVELWDRIDVLVLCCGSKGLRPFGDLSREQLDTAIDGNLKGNFMLAKKIGYAMKQTGGLGKIIALSAMSAGNTTHSAYGIGKAAQDASMDFLAFNLAPEVTVNTISPITIEQNADVKPGPDAGPLGRKIHAQEIARMCTLMCDPAFDTVTGETIRMDSGRHIASAFPRAMS